MTREQFDEMIGTPPPSTVDVMRIIARENRRTTARWAVSSAAAAALVIASIGVSLTLRPSVVDGPVTPPTPTATPSPTPTVEVAEAKAARVEDAWKQAMAKAMPTAVWRAGHDGVYDTPQTGHYYDEQYGPAIPSLMTKSNADGWKTVPWYTSDSGYRTFAIVKVGRVENGIFFHTVWRAKRAEDLLCTTNGDGVMTCGEDARCEKVPDCHRLTGPNGEQFSVTRTTNPIDEWDYPEISIEVRMLSADGTRLASLTVTNRPGTDLFPGPKGTKHVLTEEQMMQILLHPGLLI